MGQRARKRGHSGAMVRAAARAQSLQRDEATQMARRLHQTATELIEARDAGEQDPLPVGILAPLVMAAEQMQGWCVVAGGLAKDEDTARLVAAYLVSGWREIGLMFDPAHFAAWCEQTGADVPAVPPADDEPAGDEPGDEPAEDAGIG